MKFSSLSALIAAACSLGLYTVPTSASVQDNVVITATSMSEDAYFSLLRDRWSSYFLGDPNLAFDDQLNASIATINQQANEWLTSLTLSENGLWQDIPLDAESSQGKLKLGTQLYATYQRLFTLARAYKLSGGELEGNEQLLDTLIDSLTFLHDHYYHVGTAEWGNWWHWQLGISRVVNNTLVVLYDDIPYEIVLNYNNATRYFVPRPTHLSEGYGAPYSSTPFMFESTGGNRTDNAQVVLIRGILDNNAEEINSAIAALSSIIPYVEEGDGFYQDGSFIQHRDLPYSGTYGQVMIEGLGMLMGLVANTPWQANDPNLQKIYPLLLESFAPLLVDGKMMDMVNGRAISRISGQNQKVGQAMLSAMLLYVPGAPAEYKAQLTAFIQSQLQKSMHGSAFANPKIFSSYQLARQLLNNQAISPLPPRVMHKQFAEMDRIVHHRPTWTFGIAMHSNRVGNYECMNSENLKGWHTADGMTYLYNQQNDHYTGYWPVVDANKLPGTTSLITDRENCSGQLSAQRDGRQGKMDWTGGSQLDQYGAAGMLFYSWNQQLSAKKSWFMFDDEVIALGADIKNSSHLPAITTLENRKISADTPVTVNGVTLAETNGFNDTLKQLSIRYSENAAPLSYVMLDQQPATITKTCRTGNWSDIGQNKGEIAGCFIEATLPHTDTNSYAYAMLPNASFNAVNAFSEHPSVTIIANTGQVQAVEHTQLGIYAANFWDDAKAGLVTADDPMSIIIQEKEGLLQVAISDPTRSWWKTNFAIEGKYALENDPQQRIELTDSRQIKADLSGLNGTSYTFTLKPLEQANHQHKE